jgi:hypothetical protein
LLPPELPEPAEPDEPDEPPVAPVLLGEVVLLSEPVAPLAPELVLPLAPLEPEVELEPDLLKWASHSEREIWPSLFVSTDEKVGADALELAPPEDIPDEPLEPDDIPDEPLAPEEPDADGVLLLPPEDDEELCDIATPDRASSAAAVALVTSFNIDIPP